MTEEQRSRRLEHYAARTRQELASRLWREMSAIGIDVATLQARSGISRSRLLDILAARCETVTLKECVALGIAASWDDAGSISVGLGPAWSYQPDFTATPDSTG